MRAIGAALLALGCWLAGAGAQETRPERERLPEQQPEPGPDLEFLEYLGAWAEDDEEWLAIEEWRKDIGADDDREAPEQKRDEDGESDESE